MRLILDSTRRSMRESFHISLMKNLEMGGTQGSSDDREYQRSNKSYSVVSRGGEKINARLKQRPEQSGGKA